jgi:hypothetical protein
MQRDVAIFVCECVVIDGVTMPVAPWVDVYREDDAWMTVWHEGRLVAPDDFAHVRALTSATLSGPSAAFFVYALPAALVAMATSASFVWPSFAALRDDTGPEAEAVRTAWLGQELVLDARIAGYLDIPAQTTGA